MIVVIRYVKMTKETKTVTILGVRKSVTKQIPIYDSINLVRQNGAIVPNIVHSFDAANIAILVDGLLCNKIDMNLLTVHDCFATNANNVDLMVTKVKLAFLYLYLNRNFVESYHNFTLEYLIKSGFTLTPDKEFVLFEDAKNLKIPTAPKFNSDLDLEYNILSSKYIIN